MANAWLYLFAQRAAGTIVLIHDRPTKQIFAAADSLRRLQGNVLDLFGLGPSECAYRVIASGPHWHVRAYAGLGDGPAVLIVAAPIKRPYIWDLASGISPVRFCLRHGVRVYLLEWNTPRGSDDSAGLDEYVAAIGESIASIANELVGGVRPFLMGHSLGGTIAAIFAALQPESVQGLILLGSPLCFRSGVSRFRDALISLVPTRLSETEPVPGSLLSHLSALASPEIFVVSRAIDAALSATDLRASEIHARIERWTLDEVPLSGKLVTEILEWLYREDRFCREALSIRNSVVGPSCLRTPTLAVVNRSDAIAPPKSVTHFLNAMPRGTADLIEYPGETGVCLQHLAMLVGRQAHEQLWPKILAWMNAHR